MVNIKVIAGSTRPNRFSEKPAAWIFEEVKKLEGVNAELLDLRDYPMPFFDQPISPSRPEYSPTNEIVKKWTQKIAEADAFIIVTPEYNHGYPAVLKNAMDFVYHQWNKKTVGFVSYGSVAGARSIEQLRLVAIELQMAPIRNSIHIPGPVYMSAKNQTANDNTNPFEPLEDAKKNFLEQLIWWTNALKTARKQN